MSERIFIGNNDHSPQNAADEPLHEQEVKEFLCRYCDRKFSTSQSLGGHQNAHKRERLIEKMEDQRRKLEKMNSTIGITYSNQPYPYPFSSHTHDQGYSYLYGANLHMNNTMPSWAIGSPSGGYGGLQMPSSSLTTSQFEMINFLGGGQNVALPIPQRSNTLGFGLLSQANQTSSIVEGVERNFIAQFDSQTLPLLSCTDPVGENSIQENPDVSSSSTQSISEELNLNLTL